MQDQVRASMFCTAWTFCTVVMVLLTSRIAHSVRAFSLEYVDGD